jgi:hypothetical protein
MIRPFFLNYCHFTGFLAYDKRCVKNRMSQFLSMKRSDSNYNVPKVSGKINAFHIGQKSIEMAITREERTNHPRLCLHSKKKRYSRIPAKIRSRTFGNPKMVFDGKKTNFRAFRKPSKSFR